MGRIVVVGSINMDLVASAPRLPAPGETVPGRHFAAIPGGKGANQAVAIARLGAAVSLVGRLGDDPSADTLREALRAESIDLSATRSIPGPSGTAIILVDDTGTNSIVVIAGANDSLRPAELELCRELLRDAAMVLTQLEIPLATVERLATLCAESALPFMLDPAPAQPLPATLLQRVSWLTPNESETAVLLHRAGSGTRETLQPEAAAARLLATGVRNVALKLGARGVFLEGADVPPTHVPAFPVNAVDTTAAGDCFNGAFAVALSKGIAPAQAARFACAAAALSTTAAGAQPSMPAQREVEVFLTAAGT